MSRKNGKRNDRQKIAVCLWLDRNGEAASKNLRMNRALMAGTRRAEARGQNENAVLFLPFDAPGETAY